MPLIEVSIYDHRVTEESSPKIIEAMTDALVGIFGEGMRPHTTVLVHGVKPVNWGVGGQSQG